MLLWATVPLGGVAVWVVPLPGLESLPWLAASVLLHVVYTLGLVKANQVGQFSQLYPISRGRAPVLVNMAVVTGITGLNEDLSANQLLAVALILVAIMALGTSRVRREAWLPTPVVTSLLVGTAIAGYTVVGGIGVRAADSVAGHMAWLSLGLSTTTATLLSARRALRIRMRAERAPWPRAVLGALLSTTAYSLVIWVPGTRLGRPRRRPARDERRVRGLDRCRVSGEDVAVRRIFASAGVAAGLALLHLT